MTQKTLRSAVRCHPIKTMQALAAASNHSQRIDGKSKARLREGAVRGAGITWSLLFRDAAHDRSNFSNNRDVVAAFRAHKKRHGVTTDRDDLGAHLILSVPAVWLAESGSIHSSSNPRNRLAFQNGILWAEQAFGKDSVYHARMDFDEKGGGVIDVFVAPVRIDGRSKKPRISRHKALREIQARRGRRMSYMALQDDWAEWCQLHLDPQILRGRPKVETRAEHLSVEEYYEARRIAQAGIDAQVEQSNADALKASEELRAVERARAEADASKREALAELAEIRSLKATLAHAVELIRRAFGALKLLGLTVRERQAAEQVVQHVEELEAGDMALTSKPEADGSPVGRPSW